MRTVALVLFALIAISAFAGKPSLRANGGLSLAEVSKIKKVAENKWGMTLLNLAALRIVTGGALEQFWDAVQDLEEDLNTQLQEEREDWAQRSNDHDAAVLELEGRISSAEYDIASGRQRINDLEVRADTLETQIEQDGNSIQEDEQTLSDEAQTRQEEASAFAEADQVHTDAIEALDEAISLANDLVQENSPAGEASMIQVKKVKAHIKKVEAKLKKINLAEAPLAAALIKLVSSASDFQDEQDFLRVVDLLNDLRARVVASQQDIREEEEEAQANYEERTALLEDEIDTYRDRINEDTVSLTTVNAEIDETENYIDSRGDELEGYEEALESENEAYRQLEVLHNDVESELLEEIQTVDQLRSIIGNGNFADYVSNILSKEYVWEA